MMHSYQPPAAYLPHRCPLLLLERVIAVSHNQAHCQVCVDAGGILAPFLTAQNTLAGWYALELIAQTAGVWSGWHRLQRGECNDVPGMLLGARDFICHCGEFPAGALLDIQVTLLIEDGQFGSFDGQILCNNERLAQGRLNTWQPDAATLQRLFSQPLCSSQLSQQEKK